MLQYLGPHLVILNLLFVACYIHFFVSLALSCYETSRATHCGMVIFIRSVRIELYMPFNWKTCTLSLENLPSYLLFVLFSFNLSTFWLFSFNLIPQSWSSWWKMLWLIILCIYKPHNICHWHLSFHRFLSGWKMEK